jgi:nitroreductase/NAD-dependent dihydropyrimidine dehydrogenase PreA subunit
MAKIVLDKYLCVRCGQCVGTCPARLLQRNSVNEYPSVVANAEQHCISCCHCLSVCPVGAISVNGINSGMCLEIVKDNLPRFEHIATLARMRRSIRRYDDRPLENRVIEQILDVVRWTPSAMNGLPVKWLVINYREKVLELEKLVAQWFQRQPDSQHSRNLYEENAVFRGAPCVVAAYTNSTAIWPVVDAVIAIETLDLCAAAMRLGSCWAGYFIRAAQNDQEIKKQLGLAESETIQGALMLGYSRDEAYQRIPYRPELDIRWIN